jgi:acyl-CoA oxidase
VFSGLGKSLQEKGVYNTWMFQEQDQIQAFAKSYADRMVAEAFRETLEQKDVRGSSIEPILRQLFHLYLLTVMERELAWFIMHGFLKPEQGDEVIKQCIIIATKV